MQDLTVKREGRLVFRDRFCWHGPWDQTTATWHFGAADAFGSLFTTLAMTAGEPLESDTLRRASFQTAERHTCLRWLGPVEAVTTALTRQALNFAAAAEGRSRPWLLDTHDLGPNHWFAQQHGQKA